MTAPAAGNVRVHKSFYGRHSEGTKFYEAVLLCTDKNQHLLITRYGKVDKEKQGGALFIESGAAAYYKFLQLLKSKRQGGYDISEGTFAEGSRLRGTNTAGELSRNEIMSHVRFATNYGDVRNFLFSDGQPVEAVQNEPIAADEPSVPVVVKPIIRPAGWGVW